MNDSDSIARKIYDPSRGLSPADWVNTLPRPLVFTNGCFDILHRGHVHYLQQAAAFGAALVVGVNSDESVRRLDKKPNPPARPINNLADRMALLAALQSVAAVIAYDEDTPLELIKQLQPEHLVKGGDWSVDKIVGGDEVTKHGGKVHSLAFEFQRSTSDLITRIRNG